MTALPPAIEAHKLTKQFGERKAVDQLSLTLPQGAYLSIFGPNGAGKTTLLRLLSTVARPTGGTVRICGIDLSEEPDEARALMGSSAMRPLSTPT